jgi:hypothetical protein
VNREEGEEIGQGDKYRRAKQEDYGFEGHAKENANVSSGWKQL